HLYLPFVRQGNPILFMDERSAEMTKYAANAYLAARITFMNEIANLCERVGANVDQVRMGIGTDTRIGKRFLFPGVGYGGSCFPKDVQALAHTAETYGYDFPMLQAVMAVNDRQKGILVDKIRRWFDGDLRGRTIAVWGLAFKPNTDDIREAPALHIIDRLLEEGAAVRAYDPEAMDNVRRLYGDRITLCPNAYDALDGADALAIVTEWSAFRSPDFGEMRNRMKAVVLFDGRNVFDLEDIRSEVQYYESIGRHVIRTI
ncbi:MAG: UDP-glucose/GDP-mannose dehydrogenase family protein, partial [Saprospiraceae bacterium]|nr:UDP-glucose/GDP-mannose dehydrogenase family protein [Saprospiraceae bacterium]